MQVEVRGVARPIRYPASCQPFLAGVWSTPAICCGQRKTRTASRRYSLSWDEEISRLGNSWWTAWRKSSTTTRMPRVFLSPASPGTRLRPRFSRLRQVATGQFPCHMMWFWPEWLIYWLTDLVADVIFFRWNVVQRLSLSTAQNWSWDAAWDRGRSEEVETTTTWKPASEGCGSTVRTRCLCSSSLTRKIVCASYVAQRAKFAEKVHKSACLGL